MCIARTLKLKKNQLCRFSIQKLGIRINQSSWLKVDDNERSLMFVAANIANTFLVENNVSVSIILLCIIYPSTGTQHVQKQLLRRVAFSKQTSATLNLTLFCK